MLNVDLNPPDVWYDFYARLLPGVAFASYLLAAFGVKFVDINGAVVLLLLPMGFLAALVSGSLSTHIVDVLQFVGLWMYVRFNRDKLTGQQSYSTSVRKAYSQRTHGLVGAWRFYGEIESLAGQSRTKTGYTTHSKMHAECAAMVQLFILGLLAGCVVSLSRKEAWWAYLGPVLGVAVLSAFSFAYRRARRIFTRMKGLAYEFVKEEPPATGRGLSSE